MEHLRDFLSALAEVPAGRFWFLVLVSAAFAAGLLVFGFARLRRARLIEDLPTSRIRSAAQGYVELHGHARWLPGPEILAPLSGERCCWWQYRIERKVERNTFNERRSEWKVIDQGVSDDLFLLDDGTGQCVVDPVGATVVPNVSRRWRGYHPRPQAYQATSVWFGSGNYRYHERLVGYGAWLYTLGQFQTQTAFRADDESRDVSDLMAQWKRDRPEMLRRFDANGDGEIDIEEWAAARREAVRQVRAEQVERSIQPDLHVLARAPGSRPFILSTKAEHELTRGLRWGALALIAGGFALALCVVFVLMARGLA